MPWGKVHRSHLYGDDVGRKGLIKLEIVHQSLGPNNRESEKVLYLGGARLGGETVFKLRNKGMRLDMNIGGWHRFSMHLVVLGLKGLR